MVANDPTILSRIEFERDYAGRDWRRYRWLTAVCVEHGEPGLVLDLGAGFGFFVEACDRYGLRCIGLEGSEYAVEVARNRYPMDIRHYYLSQPLPFDDETIATIVLNQTIEHLMPVVAQHILRESFRVLRRGGMLVIYSPCRYDPVNAADTAHINLYTPYRLRSEVLAAGFSDYRAVDYARPIFGENRLMRLFASLAFRLTGWAVLSESANCLAYKR